MTDDVRVKGMGREKVEEEKGEAFQKENEKAEEESDGEEESDVADREEEEVPQDSGTRCQGEEECPETIEEGKNEGEISCDEEGMHKSSKLNIALQELIKIKGYRNDYKPGQQWDDLEKYAVRAFPTVGTYRGQVSAISICT